MRAPVLLLILLVALAGCVGEPRARPSPDATPSSPASAATPTPPTLTHPVYGLFTDDAFRCDASPCRELVLEPPGPVWAIELDVFTDLAAARITAIVEGVAVGALNVTLGKNRGEIVLAETPWSRAPWTIVIEPTSGSAGLMEIPPPTWREIGQPEPCPVPAPPQGNVTLGQAEATARAAWDGTAYPQPRADDTVTPRLSHIDGQGRLRALTPMECRDSLTSPGFTPEDGEAHLAWEIVLSRKDSPFGESWWTYIDTTTGSVLGKIYVS